MTNDTQARTEIDDELRENDVEEKIFAADYRYSKARDEANIQTTRKTIVNLSSVSINAPISLHATRAKIAAFQILFDREPTIYVEGSWHQVWSVVKGIFVNSEIDASQIRLAKKVKTKWITIVDDTTGDEFDVSQAGISKIHLI